VRERDFDRDREDSETEWKDLHKVMNIERQMKIHQNDVKTDGNTSE
jgi:hypothetical protein